MTVCGPLEAAQNNMSKDLAMWRVFILVVLG